MQMIVIVIAYRGIINCEEPGEKTTRQAPWNNQVLSTRALEISKCEFSPIILVRNGLNEENIRDKNPDTQCLKILGEDVVSISHCDIVWPIFLDKLKIY